MKQVISTTLLLSSFSLASCDGLHNKIWSNTVNPEPIAPITNSPLPNTNLSPKIDIIKTADGKPKVATIKSMIQGDVKCYVVVEDEGGLKQELPAISNVCAEGEEFLSKKVNLTYETVNINDCQSNEPCGKTEDESLIAKMDVLGNAATNTNDSPDIVTLKNGKWIVTIGGLNSWNGVNGTGNLTYYGCSSGGKCIKLRGGKVNCQQGECTITWKNGNQDYIVKGKMNSENDEAFVSPSTLIVRESNKVIATAEGLRPLK